MSNYAYPIKEIIYDKEIQDFNTAGLFASCMNTEYNDILCITPDTIEIAEKFLFSDDEVEELVADGKYTKDDVNEARSLCEHYKQVMKERELEYLEFHCY